MQYHVYDIVDIAYDITDKNYDIIDNLRFMNII
jgi:hypothetical protein